MPTQKQLIGNVRGPQGEAGQPVRIIAQTYAYQASSNGTTPPTGPWLPAVPQAGQGEYIWTRNTTTYDDGDDSVTYSVAYQGKDGSYAGESDVAGIKAKVQELEDRVVPVEKGGLGTTTIEGVKAKVGIDEVNKRIDGINDYTTGINLLRGTRDFKRGAYPAIPQTVYFYDGWSVSVDTNASKYIDADGFTAINISQSTDAVKAVYSSMVSGLLPGEVLTASFEFMVDDVNNYNLKENAVFRYDVFNPDSGSSIAGANYTASDGGVKEIQSGVWYRWSRSFTPSSITSADNLIMFSVRLNRAGSANFRKVKVEKGKINSPIYSPNPFDENDYTTGINLLRGTRDFTLGTQVSGTREVTYYDGWSANATNLTREVDSDGYGNIVTLDTDTSGVLRANPLFDEISGKAVTLSCEVMFTERPKANQSIMQIGVFQKSTTTSLSGSIQYMTISDSGYDYSNVPINEWVPVHKAFTLPVFGSDYYVRTSVYKSQVSVETRVRKPALYLGNINNPIWSANPFDVAQAVDLNYVTNHTPKYLSGMASDSKYNFVNNGITDLNDATDFGVYVCSQGNLAQTIKNTPRTANLAFYMEVIDTVGNGYSITQRLQFYADTYFYTRHKSKDNAEWSSWAMSYDGNSLTQAKVGEILGVTKQDITALENRVKTLEDQIKLLTQ